jgi:uncharacterized protein YceH (UPF0502 family)
MSNDSTAGRSEDPPKWRPIGALQRRILGVLVEKAKTTPDAYPLSLNAMVSGCNQKSNRDPQMQVDADEVEHALDALREMGAVGEVHGGGRVIRYRHYMKEWLGVDGTELAVMAELLLRGAQTVGELRGRAARMAPDQLADLSGLRPVVDALTGRGLVVALTPEGRGQIVTHALYPAQEMEQLRRKTGMAAVAAATVLREPGSPHPAANISAPLETLAPAAAATVGGAMSDIEQLRSEVSQMHAELQKLRKDVEDIWASLR